MMSSNKIEVCGQLGGNTSKGKYIYLSNPLSEGGFFLLCTMIDIKMKSNYKNPKGLWDDI